ncbi:hypothetical protein M2444_006692 [Paenibacillus sp. PastF-3]|jgi:hypothetical protein|nr:hypothetical protein [Paenibacillus sp. PastF-3]
MFMNFYHSIDLVWGSWGIKGREEVKLCSLNRTGRNLNAEVNDDTE